MAKIVGARQAAGQIRSSGQTVYCSKNNANIARIPYLAQSFPGSRIVVPVRRPASHAASLLRQHHNFLRQQAEDPFIRRYMRDIGHFEFGQIQKPLMFPGFRVDAYDPTLPDYWLNYWVHAFREIHSHADRCLFVLQDDLRRSPVDTMTALCRTLNLDAGQVDFRSYFHSAADETATDIFDPVLLGAATGLYAEIEALARKQRAKS